MNAGGKHDEIHQEGLREGNAAAVPAPGAGTRFCSSRWNFLPDKPSSSTIRGDQQGLLSSRDNFVDHHRRRDARVERSQRGDEGALPPAADGCRRPGDDRPDWTGQEALLREAIAFLTVFSIRGGTSLTSVTASTERLNQQRTDRPPHGTPLLQRDTGDPRPGPWVGRSNGTVIDVQRNRRASANHEQRHQSVERLSNAL